VVVHGKQAADNGEMVIAMVNGNEATVKRYYREQGGWIRLQPANPAMQPLRFQERDVLIQGVVVGVIRKY
jgi:repressor LexA